AKAVRYEGFSILLRLLSPIVPHICHVLWRALAFGPDILEAPWPQVDEAALTRDTLELVVQVNGKVRGKIQVASDASQETIRATALEDAHVQRYVGDQPVRKVIVVPGRLVNVVC
ncbi:MAG: class I tRNA ligase family protein, partial [Candidatus Competibacterales bacterium]